MRGGRGWREAARDAALIVSALASALVMATAGSATAYELNRTDKGDLVRWFVRGEPVPFMIGAVAPEELSVEVVAAVVQTAWDTWRVAAREQCPEVPTAAYRGRSEATGPTRPASFDEHPDNLVLFVRTAGEWAAMGRGVTEIAIAVVASNDRTGEIVDVDILVNDARWRLRVGQFESVVPGDIDFASTMTHEVGHALGLLHSLEPSATMFATYSNVEPSGARTLADDDRAGLCALYRGAPQHVAGRRVDDCSVGSRDDLLLVAVIGILARAFGRGHRGAGSQWRGHV